MADRLPGRYRAGSVASLSFDKGFMRTADRELLSLYVPEVVMPNRGKKNAAETERKSEKKFVTLRKQHSAVESEINSLEHHGLNRCLDVGLKGYQRYVGYGVLSYNLHVIGRDLLARERARGDTLALGTRGPPPCSSQPSPTGAVSSATEIFGKVGVTDRKISRGTRVSPTPRPPQFPKTPISGQRLLRTSEIQRSPPHLKRVD